MKYVSSLGEVAGLTAGSILFNTYQDHRIILAEIMTTPAKMYSMLEYTAIVVTLSGRPVVKRTSLSASDLSHYDVFCIKAGHDILDELSVSAVILNSDMVGDTCRALLSLKNTTPMI